MKTKIAQIDLVRVGEMETEYLLVAGEIELAAMGVDDLAVKKIVMKEFAVEMLFGGSREDSLQVWRPRLVLVRYDWGVLTRNVEASREWMADNRENAVVPQDG